METKTKVLAIGGTILAGVIVVAARFLPGKEGEVKQLYWFDGTTWIGLPGAIFEPGEAVVFGGKCKNLSSVPLNVVIEFILIGPNDYMAMETFTDPIAPNEEVTYPYSASLGMAGEYTLTVIMYEEETMRELDRMTVSVLVTEEVVPAEFVLSNLRFNSPIEVGQYLGPQVAVTNVGSQTGICEVTCIIDGVALTPRTKELSPGETYNFAWTWRATTLGTFTISMVGPTNTLTDIFVVGGAPPEARGHILAIMADINGDNWQYLDGLEFQLNQIVPLVVSWASDMGPGDPDIRGHVILQVVRPDGILFYLPDISGQDSIVAPGQAGQVYFEVNFFQAGSWYFEAILDGEIV